MLNDCECHDGFHTSHFMIFFNSGLLRFSPKILEDSSTRSFLSWCNLWRVLSVMLHHMNRPPTNKHNMLGNQFNTKNNFILHIDHYTCLWRMMSH